MAASLVPDLPAVNIALAHLGELDKQLRAERVAFIQEASHHLIEIVDAIKELEVSRKVAHEELEVETIETGKFRHLLLSQRDAIVAEISAAVAAARAAKATELNHLQLEMLNVVQDQESMEKRQMLLEEQNVILFQSGAYVSNASRPEHQRLDADYAELTKQLNRQLSEKAVMQITLKATRKEIQTMREKIAHVHLVRNDLQENKIRDRKQFEETKEMLKKEIYETMNTIQAQTKINTELQKELGMALTELVKKDERVDELSNQILLLEKHANSLKASRQKHKEQNKNKINKLDELTKQIKLCEKELVVLRNTLNLQLLSLKEDIEAVERETEEELKEHSFRLDALSKLSSIFQVQRKKEEDAQKDYSQRKRNLEKLKQRLDESFNSTAKYKLEIKEMEKELKRLHEANKVSVEMFQKNLVELERQLVKQKQSRASFEIKREELCVNIEILKEQHEDSVRTLHSAILLYRTRYSELTEEKKKLQEHEVLSALIEELTHRISIVEEECKQLEIKYNTEIQQLNTQSKSIARAHQDEEKELKDQESMFSKVKAQFNIDQSRRQTLKQQTTELKARRSHLERSIQEVKERTAVMLQSKEALKKELQTLQENHMELLHSHAEQISATARGVYEKGLMLEQVKMENSRLHLCIEQMKMDIVNARKEKEKHTQEISWMKENGQSIYKSLVGAWHKDNQATEESAENDQKLLDAMKIFMLQVQKRKQHTGDINMKLETELKAMSALLEINSQE